MTVCNLGVTMNTHLDASDQISAEGRCHNYHLRRIAQVPRYISDEACKSAVLALVIRCSDYCKGLLAGATERLCEKLQRIQNRAARSVARPWVPRGQILYITAVRSSVIASLLGSVLSTNSGCMSSCDCMGLRLHTSRNC